MCLQVNSQYLCKSLLCHCQMPFMVCCHVIVSFIPLHTFALSYPHLAFPPHTFQLSLPFWPSRFKPIQDISLRVQSILYSPLWTSPLYTLYSIPYKPYILHKHICKEFLLVCHTVTSHVNQRYSQWRLSFTGIFLKLARMDCWICHICLSASNNLAPNGQIF